MSRRRDPLADPVRFVDERLGAARPIRFLLDYVFPDHWSFLLGEIALYAFIVLVLTGTFLALFFSPGTGQVVYHGPYAPLAGQQVSHAYSSTLALSFTVKGGLLMRQTHHWAALVFVAAITVHLLRIVFTGAFRKPRELNYLIGVTLLASPSSRASAATRCPTTCSRGSGSRSLGGWRCRSRSSAARSRTPSGAGCFPARPPSSRGSTSSTCS